MGQLDVTSAESETQRQRFMKALLDDVRALELMLDTDLFERGVRRIGAEQEMFLVDAAGRPAPIALDLLDKIDDPRFTYELGRFNIEANLDPHLLGGNCLSALEAESLEVVAKARQVARGMGNDVVLTGILPTLHQSHLSLACMVPEPRYFALNDSLKKLRGSDFHFTIKGVDRIDIKHDNLMLEACNTSFQVHFQVAPEEFARFYNYAQTVTGPVLACAANSPLLLGKRLWRETRIAVFEHSVDARSDAHQVRGMKPRVHFGDHWIDEGVQEIFREDIARFRVILTSDVDEDPIARVKAGKVPKLAALCLHNGTVYRWNRACYGQSGDNKAHLRIEHRTLPGGPSVADEVAHAAFFFGLMAALAEKVEDVRDHISFEEVKSNFFAAARDGLKAQQTWLDGEHRPAGELITRTLLPLAADGLATSGIDNGDIERYMGIIDARVMSKQTGARWALQSLQNMDGQGTADQRLRQLVSSSIVGQENNTPGHEWPLTEFCEKQDWRESYRTVGQFMTTDLFTVRPDDLVDFAASLMDWKHLRHVPVEDDSGHLVGLVSHRALLRLVAEGKVGQSPPVREVMHEKPRTVSPDTPTVDAIVLMREEQMGCLPVLEGEKLVGLVTERELIKVSGWLLEEQLRN